MISTSLVELLVVTSVVIFCSRQLSQEECVDESGPSQTRLALIRV